MPIPEVPKLEVAIERGEKTSFGEQTKALPAHSIANDLVLWFSFERKFDKLNCSPFKECPSF